MQNYAQKQFIDYQTQMAGNGDSSPNRLDGCDRLLADAQDAEVTYFQQFFLFQPSQAPTSGRAA